MSEILTDAKFTIVEATEGLYVNNSLIVDRYSTIRINALNANVIYYNHLVQNPSSNSIGSISFDRSFQPQSSSSSLQPPLPENTEWLLSLQGVNNISYTDSVTVGGIQNEASGEHSVCVGGNGNETSGVCSIVLGGSDNRTVGDHSIACGTNSIAVHENTFVFNSSEQPVQTTTDSQFLINATKGMFFKIPVSSTIRTDHVSEGFAVWCWDDRANTLCLKTKQNNTLYKTSLPTLKHEIQVVIDGEGFVNLINPDRS
jgi:hypothetical protein